jgi:prepilin-type N-terminal cleavage/methylation domain-containing protein
MKRRKLDAQSASWREYGFSLTELVVTLAVALILMAIGLPSFLRAYHSYLLTNSASQMADILRLSRYEAIRLNTQVNCQGQTYTGDPTMTTVWAGNGSQGTGDKMILLGSSGNLVAAGTVPQTATLLSQAVSGVTPATPSPPGSGVAPLVTFDARGAVTPPNVNAFYLGSAIAPDAGYRAVLLMPAGSIQIWTADASGYWQQVR